MQKVQIYIWSFLKALSVALPKSQFHSPTLPSLYLRHSSFSKPSVALSISQLILQPFRLFTYVTAHSPTLPSLYLCHSSFSNPSVALPTSQLILQPFRCFTYVTAHSPALLSLLLSHRFSPDEPPMAPNSRLELVGFVDYCIKNMYVVELKEKNYILNWDLNPGL